MTTPDVQPAPSVVVTIDGHPPNANQKRRMHHFREAESNRVWRRAAFMLGKQALRESRIHGTPFDRATLEVVWLYRVERRRDTTGVIEAIKPLVDGLVDCGLLLDDDSRHLVSVTASLEKGAADAVRLIVSRA